MKNSAWFTLVMLIAACQPASKKSFWGSHNDAEITQDITFESFTRENILARLQKKMSTGKPLIVHVFVPLCDNKYQGIVPVSSSLGNGQSPATNLYWGAAYGIKTFFKHSQNWKLLSIVKTPLKHVLERAVFERKLSDGARVLLVADAYDGRFMQQCITDFLQSISGQKEGKITYETHALRGYTAADLCVFNGHNGLMDTDVNIQVNKGAPEKDAMVIACSSANYFRPHLKAAKGYPLLCTTNLLAPEAYVIEAAITAWASLKSGSEIRSTAGAAYHKYQKCGLKGATNLFCTGWGE